MNLCYFVNNTPFISNSPFLKTDRIQSRRNSYVIFFHYLRAERRWKKPNATCLLKVLLYILIDPAMWSHVFNEKPAYSCSVKCAWMSTGYWDTVLFGVILFSCIVTRASAFLLRAVNCLACVDCLRRVVGSLRLQPCSEVAVRLTSLMLFHSLYVAWSSAADSTNKFNKAFIRSHHLYCRSSICEGKTASNVHKFPWNMEISVCQENSRLAIPAKLAWASVKRSVKWYTLCTKNSLTSKRASTSLRRYLLVHVQNYRTGVTRNWLERFC